MERFKDFLAALVFLALVGLGLGGIVAFFIADPLLCLGSIVAGLLFAVLLNWAFERII